MNLESLPPEIICKITSDIEVQELIGFSGVSKNCNTLFYKSVKKLCCEGVTQKQINSFLGILDRFSALINITLPNNHILSSSIISVLSKLPIQLESLSFVPVNTKRKDKITDTLLDEISQITSLRDLNLGGCSLITDKGIGKLTSLQKLQCLNLYGCMELSNQIFTDISKLNSLQKLILSGCYKITSLGLASFQVPPLLTNVVTETCSQINENAKVELTKTYPNLSFSKAS